VRYLELLLSLLVQGNADCGFPLPLGQGGGLPLGDSAALQGGANRLGFSPVLCLFTTYQRTTRKKQNVGCLMCATAVGAAFIVPTCGYFGEQRQQ